MGPGDEWELVTHVRGGWGGGGNGMFWAEEMAFRSPARRTFLVVQWIRSMLPMQGGWV